MNGIIRPHYGSAITGRERDLIVGYEMEPIEGKLVNKEVSGAAGGSDGTNNGATAKRDQIHGSGIHFDGVDDNATYTQTGDTVTAGSICLTFRPRSYDPALPTYILLCRNLNSRYYIAFRSSTGELRTIFKENDIGWEDTGFTPLIGKSYRLVVTWTTGATTDVVVYVDGVAIDSYSVPPLQLNMDTIYLGSTDGPGQWGDVEIGEHLLLRRALTAEDAARDYQEFAQRAHYLIDFDRFNVSPAAEGGTVGAFLSNTPFQFGDAVGRWQVVDATIEGRRTKSIRCTTAGVLYVPVTTLGLNEADPEAAYGTMEFLLNKAAISDTFVYFIADTPTLGSLDGYALRVWTNEALYLREYVAGAGSNLMSTAAGTFSHSTWHRLKPPRRYDGRFTICLDGVPVEAATGSNPVSDNTAKAGSYIVFDLDADDEIGGLSHRWGECL